MKWLYLALVVALLSACGSTPYRDDYAKHVQLNSTQFISPHELSWAIELTAPVELRGKYQQNNTLGSSAILYDGSAGLAGMLVQVGVHAAMINSGRDSKLSEQQMHANNNIKMLDELTGDLSLGDILSVEVKQSITASADTNTVFVKPIFFSDQRMRRLTLKLIAWIPKDISKAPVKERDYRYQNMIQVYDSLPEDDDSNLLDLTQADLHKRYQSLLDIGLKIVANDVSGQYQLDDTQSQTFTVKYDDRNTVIRGKLAEHTCTHEIIKDLRNWFIAVPNLQQASLESSDLIASC